MKLLYFILIALICALAHAQEGGSFEITFYEQPNYKNQNGRVFGSVLPGGSSWTNITVGSFKAPSWLYVTLFDDPRFKNRFQVYQGSQKNISPPTTVRSIKWRRL